MEVFSEASALVFSRRESQALRFPLAEPLTPPCNSEHPPAQQENSLQFCLGETAKTATTRLGWAGLGEGEYSVSYGFHTCARGTCKVTQWEFLLHTTIVFTPPCHW